MAKITVSLMRDLEKQVLKGEISYSRMIEILNETALSSQLGKVPTKQFEDIQADIRNKLSPLKTLTTLSYLTESEMAKVSSLIPELEKECEKSIEYLSNFLLNQEIGSDELMRVFVENEKKLDRIINVLSSPSSTVLPENELSENELYQLLKEEYNKQTTDTNDNFLRRFAKVAHSKMSVSQTNNEK